MNDLRDFKNLEKMNPIEYLNKASEKTRKSIIDYTFANESGEKTLKNDSMVKSVIFRKPKDMKGKNFIEEFSIDEIKKMANSKCDIQGDNSVLVGGTQRTVMNLWDFAVPATRIATFEEMMQVEGTMEPIDAGKGDYRIKGFNVANDGCICATTVLPVYRHLLGYDFDTLIPFRMLPLSSDDPETFFQFYYHRRVIEFEGEQYVQYFTKKFTPTFKNVTTEGTELPDNPESNYKGTLDVRTLVEFPITITKLELNEWYEIVMGDGKATQYSAVIPMIGLKTKQTVGGQQYDALNDTQAYSRANHLPAICGYLGSSDLAYILMYM